MKCKVCGSEMRRRKACAGTRYYCPNGDCSVIFVIPGRRNSVMKWVEETRSKI